MKRLSGIILLAGLSPAAAQLPPIDAGGILNQINSSHPFPAAPAPTTLDYCMFSDFKNNKCYFRCESGAILIEPAVRPDFSSGEPAGACATHIIRPVAAPQLKDRYIGQFELRALLRDPDPEVRKAAVKASKSHILNSYAYEQVMEMLKSPGERADIRVEAARVLSHATAYYRVQEALGGAARGAGQPKELRVMAHKALWSAADLNIRWQEFLMSAVKEEADRAIRSAAIWALWASAENYKPRDLLKGLAGDRGIDEAVRIEAIKSLYRAMGNYEIKELVSDLARDNSDRKPVRLAAIFALSAASGDSRVQDLLEDLSERAADTDLRVAAIEALSPDLTRVREYFHLGYKNENGSFISPIEKE